MLVRLQSPEAFPFASCMAAAAQRRPQAMRWREWMGRVEAAIFASPAPVTRDALAKLVGRACNLDHRCRTFATICAEGRASSSLSSAVMLPQMCGAVSRSIPPGKSSTGSLI